MRDPVRMSALGRPIRIQVQPMSKAADDHRLAASRHSLAIMSVMAAVLVAAVLFAFVRLVEYADFLAAAARV